jgi:hypothetical protein
VVDLAAQLYSTHTISIADVNTIACKINGGVTYLPIPPGTGENFAGLLTIDLPQTVAVGQEFSVLVRRVSTRMEQDIILETRTLPSEVRPTERKGKAAARPRKAQEAAAEAAAEEPGLRTWRYVVGTFAVKIPVATRDSMLLPEENTLAILRWRLEQLPPASRWYPVLDRYVDLVAARVDGLGGDSTKILPSPTGVPVRVRGRHHERSFEGRVEEILFDCFGDFEGFALAECEGSRTFRSRKHGIERLVVLACTHDLTLVVTVDDADEDRIVRLALRGC